MASQRFAKFKVMALEALTLWERNYRQGNVEIIRNSILRFGFNSTVRVRGGVVYAGNHSVKALLELQASGAPPPPGIEVSRGRWMVPCMDISHLSEEEAMAFAIADNRASDMAVNDDDALAALLSELQTGEGLVGTGFSDDELGQLLAELAKGQWDGEPDGGSDPNYERTIEAPVYEPKGECPAVTVLTDQTKASELLRAIKAAILPPDVRKFLELAANRHVIFDYEQIAEFYCHAPAEVQRLMEDSALVIIDFNQAVEKGFVQLVGALGEAYDADLAAVTAGE